jgi:two-component system, NtrC family, response regulator AtoC
MSEKPNPRVLLIEDDHTYRELLARRLNQKGYEALAFATGEEALQSLRDKEFDVAVVDLSLPGMNGIEVLKRLRDDRTPIESIMLTGNGGVKDAVEAMKLGAYHYLEKPIKIAELKVYIDKAYEKRCLEQDFKGLKQDYKGLKEVVERSRKTPLLVGSSGVMQRLRQMLEKYAPHSLPVLIEGETGTGKDVCAHLIHDLSDRKDGPFIAINCGALAESLLENELFGHAKGAYTSADSEQRGVFEMADGGTLFIDEVCEMSLEIQKKFLRVLENGEFRRLGDAKIRKVSVRVVAATNRVVLEEVEAKRFRQDLYYRLRYLELKTPPLRVHKEDIQDLVEFFLTKNAGRYPKGVQVSEEVLKAFGTYDWPGNVRELQAVLERGIVLSSDGVVRPGDCPGLNFDAVPKLPSSGSVSSGNGNMGDTGSSDASATPLTLEELECRHLKSVLDQAGGNKTKAAKLLGISLRSLYRKLERHEIE